MKFVLVLIAIVASVNFANAQTSQKSPEYQVIANKLIEEINNTLQCRAALITDQAELQKVKAELEELTKKVDKK